MSDPLTKDEVRQLLRECVTVVKPGEVLVIRGLENWTVQQMREVQDVLNAMHEHGLVPFRSLVVPGAELGVAEAPSGPFGPILPVPVDDRDAPRPEPRRFQYHVGGPCPSPAEDGTCGCDPGAGFLP